MTTFLRPQARYTMWRWREALYGAAIALLGLWWAIKGVLLVQTLGMVVAAIGALFIVAGLQRGRFRQAGDGPGVVQVAERRITYFGPLGGGGIDISDLTMLTIDPTAKSAAHWILSSPMQRDIAVPVNAAGADALFDAFGALSGLDTQVLLHTLNNLPTTQKVVWAKTPALIH